MSFSFWKFAWSKARTLFAFECTTQADSGSPLDYSSDCTAMLRNFCFQYCRGTCVQQACRT